MTKGGNSHIMSLTAATHWLHLKVLSFIEDHHIQSSASYSIDKCAI